MTLTEWRDHLETLGPDLSLWPPRIAEAGLELMERSDAAKDAFARVCRRRARTAARLARSPGEAASPSPDSLAAG